MHGQAKLSLLEAIFINITIMIGTGLFINTVVLAQSNGAFVLVNFLLTALLMLPLVFSFAQLSRLYPSGGFYTFAAATINPLVGFSSAWIYFFAKLASSTLGMHVFVSLMQQIIPPLKTVPTLFLDFCIISLCTILNLFNLKTGSQLIKYFFVLKLIPIVTVISAACFYGHTTNLIDLSGSSSSILYTMPLVLFTLLGFEASCSLSNQIENAKQNAGRAILLSFGIVVALSIMYQLGFYLLLGTQFLQFADYRDAFPALFKIILPNQAYLQNGIYTLIHACIASSAFSGAYGMFYSVRWNIITIAEHGHLGKLGALVSRLNNYQSPLVCTIGSGLICFCYLLITQGNLTTLQQTSAFGCTITYAISAFSLFLHYKKNKQCANLLLPITALLSCAVLTSICFYNLYTTGFGALVALSSISMCGLLLYRK